jgi:uncharacterized damage-inducible protein DinB
MSRKQVILEQILYGHNKNGWFVSFQNAVEGLTPKQAAWKNSETDHSIAEIVNHLNFWNNHVLNLFKGIENPKMEGNNDSTFESGVQWLDIEMRYNQLLTEWYDAVNNCEEAKLDQPVSEENKGTWIGTLSSITLHNVYHIGQIVAIRKIQGSWDPKHGVS